MTIEETIAHAEPELKAATLDALKVSEAARAEYHRLLIMAVTDSQKRQLASKRTWADMSTFDRAMDAMREDEAMRDKPPVAVAGDYCRPVEYMSDGTERIRRNPVRGRGVDEGLM